MYSIFKFNQIQLPHGFVMNGQQGGNKGFEIQGGPGQIQGNMITVDDVYGNDDTASVGGSAFKTIDVAVNNSYSGTIIQILPGTYEIPSIIIPDNVTLRGVHQQRCVLTRKVTTDCDTEFITLHKYSSIENLTLVMNDFNAYRLFGIINYEYTMIKNVTLTIDNSMTNLPTSDVTGIVYYGYSDNVHQAILENTTIHILSNGDGKKRGINVPVTTTILANNVYIYVAAPPDPNSIGSYVGVETNDSSGQGRIEFRSSTIYAVSSEKNTSSDILQTTPLLSKSLSGGIYIGPGTDLVTKTAGSLGFYPYLNSTITYGIIGYIRNINIPSWLYPGYNTVSCDEPYPYYEVHKPMIMLGVCCSMQQGPGMGSFVSINILLNHLSTNFNFLIQDCSSHDSYYDSSLHLNVGDKIYVKMIYDGGSNIARDVTVHIHFF